MTSPSPDGPRDDRSPLAIAYGWAWRVIAIALEMVIPGLLGYALDQLLGTQAVFMVLGFLAGMVLGVWHLVHLGRGPASRK